MKFLLKNKIILLIGGTAGLLFILIVIFSFLSSGRKPNKQEKVTNESFKSIEVLPTLPREQGGGLNENASEIKSSTNEIEKLQSKLPYRTTVELPGISPIAVGIPSVLYLDNAWTLIVYVEVDFQAPAGSTEYNTNKELFREAAKKVNEWIIEQDADPKKIFIQWGDDEFSQQRAKEWLEK